MKISTHYHTDYIPITYVLQGLKGALQALFMQNMAKGDMEDIFSILGIDEAILVDEKLFASIVGFSERVLCPRMAYV